MNFVTQQERWRLLLRDLRPHGARLRKALHRTKGTESHELIIAPVHARGFLRTIARACPPCGSVTENRLIGR